MALEQLTLLLFERIGLFLVGTFILTRIPQFRQLLDRQVSLRTSLYFSVVFGLFGIAGTYAGVVVDKTTHLPGFWITILQPNEAIANSSLVGVVIGGLLGGPVVGVGAGLITGLHLYTLGGMVALPAALSAPLTGVLAGLIARFFSQERVISPEKSLFIGMFAPILQMGLILILASPPHEAIQLVNTIGIPMVLTNSIAIAIVTTMIRVALKEEERTAAFEAERALKIAELILPHLKLGLTPQTAEKTARILKKELQVTAVAVTNTELILAHIGIGSDHHLSGEIMLTEISRAAISTGTVQIAHNREEVRCRQKDCPLGAAIVIPFSQAGSVVGLIKLYYQRAQQIRKIEEAVAKGLGNLISNQLNLAVAERITSLMRDAELRLLQAQINPHFLFNTLNAIVTLIRIDPDLARHMTVQLGYFMRLNLKLTSAKLVPVAQEISQLQAFLEIIKIRFADQFTVECEVDPGLEHVMIPPVTLQPLVENSMQHGLRDKPSGGMIQIRVQRRDEHVYIAISDNGAGIPADKLNQLGEVPVASRDGNGIGIYNVNQRLISLFNTSSRLHYENIAGGGSRVSFTIPYTSDEGMMDG